jgi:hypothetical protein
LTRKARFALKHVVLVRDRGMITQTRIDEDIAPAGLDWITAPRAPAIRALVEAGELQLSLFDRRDMATTCWPRPNVTTAAVARARQPLRGKDQIGLKVGWPSTSNSTSARRPLRSAARPHRGRDARGYEPLRTKPRRIKNCEKHMWLAGHFTVMKVELLRSRTRRFNRRIHGFDRIAVKILAGFRKLVVGDHHFLAFLRFAGGHTLRPFRVYPGVVDLGGDHLD